jgi:hypothetical protein
MRSHGTTAPSRALTTVAFLVASACTADPEPRLEERDSGGTDVDSGTIDTLDGPAEDSDGITGDASPDVRDEGSGHPAPIPDIPSRQEVRIELVNRSDGPIWLLRVGADCAGMKLESLGFVGLGGWFELPLVAHSRDPEDWCCFSFCDVGDPAATFEEVPAGGSAIVVWDGRAAVLSEETYPCLTAEFHETGLQPVKPGRYRITLGLRLELDPTCSESSPGHVDCTYGSFYDLWPVETMCRVPETVSVEFDLPSDGDLALEISHP